MSPRRGGRRHPLQAEVWSWDDGNERELARHRIVPREVEEVWTNGPGWAANKRYHAGDWKMIGTTNGGRRLAIVVRYEHSARTIRPITGWECTGGEVSRYFPE